MTATATVTGFPPPRPVSYANPIGNRKHSGTGSGAGLKIQEYELVTDGDRLLRSMSEYTVGDQLFQP